MWRVESTLLRRLARLGLLIAASLTAVTAPAGQSGVFLISSHDEGPYRQTINSFETYLADQGVDLELEISSLHGKATNAPRMISRIAESDPALVLALGHLAARAVVERIKDRPILIALVLKLDHLAKAQNVTGVEMVYPPRVYLELIKRVCDRCRTVGVVFGSNDSMAYAESAREAAPEYGLELMSAAVASPKHLPAALKRLERRVDALWVLPDKAVAAPQSAKAILLHSFRQRTPLVGPSTPWTKAGALCALDWDYDEMGRQVGELAVQILQGAEIRNVAPRGPNNVLYSLNLKTAKHVKLEMSPDFIKGARELFD
jgi:putative ABC transport system substrate-binding protein